MKPNEWSKAVVDRDGKCVDCGILEPLHAHHLKPKALYPELRFDVSNGVAVCPTCHWKRHEADRGTRLRGASSVPQRKTLIRKLGEANLKIAEYKVRVKEMAAEIEELRSALNAVGRGASENCEIISSTLSACGVWLTGDRNGFEGDKQAD